MIKNLALFLFILMFISACSESDTSSSGGSDSDPTAASKEESSDSEAPSKTEDRSKECLSGTYEFRTDSDGKKHFDAQFVSGGVINYNLRGGPTGSWKLDGSTVTIVGPFGAGRANATLTFTVSRTGADCLVTQFRGSSLGGAALTVTRI